MAKKDKNEVEVEVSEDGTRLNFTKIEEYVPGVSGSGKRTKNNGDPIATALNGMTLEEVEQLAARMKVEHPDYSQPRENGKILNIGMQRMNIGNKIRGAVNAAEKVEEGSGYALLESKSGSIRKTVDKRLDKAEAEAAKAKEEKAEAAKAKKAAEKAAEKAKEKEAA